VIADIAPMEQWWHLHLGQLFHDAASVIIERNVYYCASCAAYAAFGFVAGLMFGIWAVIG
jgi:hypothetical protein